MDGVDTVTPHLVLFLIAIVVSIAIPAVGVLILVTLVIFLTREWSHNEMCKEICKGDMKKAKELHEKYHNDGLI